MTANRHNYKPSDARRMSLDDDPEQTWTQWAQANTKGLTTDEMTAWLEAHDAESTFRLATDQLDSASPRVRATAEKIIVALVNHGLFSVTTPVTMRPVVRDDAGRIVGMVETSGTITDGVVRDHAGRIVGRLESGTLEDDVA